jgi:hypothetical protein
MNGRRLGTRRLKDLEQRSVPLDDLIGLARARFRTRSVTKKGYKTRHHEHRSASDTARGFRVPFECSSCHIFLLREHFDRAANGSL